MLTYPLQIFLEKEKYSWSLWPIRRPEGISGPFKDVFENMHLQSSQLTWRPGFSVSLCNRTQLTFRKVICLFLTVIYEQCYDNSK